MSSQVTRRTLKVVFSTAAMAWLTMAPGTVLPGLMKSVHAAQADDTAKNAEQARTMLNAMVKALGGDAWLNQQNRMYEGRTAGFYHGKPSGATAEYWEFHAWPDK